MERPKLLLDTNFFIRFLTGDHPIQSKVCTDLIAQIQAGKITPYISSIVLLECFFVLKRNYQISETNIDPMLQAIVNLRNAKILEKTNTLLALEWHQKTRVKFTDCLIATQLKPGITLCTYDQEFKKLPTIITQTPSEILASCAFQLD